MGASAGGLEAFQNFLSAVPADAGLAFVLVQHLDPNHESMLAELLGRRTQMPVRQIADGMAIEPNNVYLIPPNASLIVERAALRLSDFSEPRGFRRPIDVFFRSLAVDQGSNAACVVLSGTGGDGSEGLRAVKEAGGLTIVQEPDTAKYDGMPKSAVATGFVDKVLRVEEMPAAIRDYFDRGQANLNPPDIEDFLLRVCEQMRNRLGHDFSQYKRSTMLRRVQRRMQVVAASDAETYLERLSDDPREAELLFRDLLINVTCFFRDSEAFDFLRREVIPKLISQKGAGDTVRIWVPGCSSGEEPYSIAILMAEALSRQRDRPSVQIFATDIDEPILHKARLARYPHSAVKDVPIELLDRYFYAQDDDFVLTQSIRDMVRISNHNLIKDPPFSRCDLIACRNLLIYLNASLQQRLIPVFHYGLRQGAWLFLGSAENIAGRTDLFDAVDAEAKIYKRLGSSRQSVAMPLVREPARAGMNMREARNNSNFDKGDMVARRVMDRYAPAHVVLDSDNTVTRSSKRTGRYLELAEGTPSNKVMDLARPGLRSAIRSVLEGTRKSGKRTIKRDVRMDTEDAHAPVNVVADPLDETTILLVFQDGAAALPEMGEEAEVQVDSYSDDQRIKELEDELSELRTKLRTTVEELETSNEELKSSNEEMMSMNEELQSTNEELATVNEELKNKVEELARANSDLENFIDSTQIPTIFLDQELRIRSFTPASRKLFRFQDQDQGRKFSDVVSRADQRHLEEIAMQVLQTGTPFEEELSIDDGSECYVLRAMPYRDSHHNIDGVILLFSDVTKIRETQESLARNERIARERNVEIETLYKNATVGMALVDRNLRYLKVNKQFADMDGASIEDHVGRTLSDMLPEFAGRIERPIAEVFDHGEEVTNLEMTLRVEDDEQSDFLVDVYPYEQDDRVTAVGIVLKNVTEVRRLEKELRRLMDELQHRVKNTLATVSSVINQTIASNNEPEEIFTTLKQRVGALAATHHLLTSREWRDASLSKILDAELVPFGHSERISVSGPNVSLPPKHALTLTLTLHELATNAAKYGALAHDTGELKIDWVETTDADGRWLILNWVETGVPVGKIDHNAGFGTKLITKAVPHDLQGECVYELTEGGVRCMLRVPLE